MIVSIHQPAYLPWLGYFDKIMRSDVFVYLDTVQFQKNSFQNRNKIRTADGWAWLTVPVITKGVLYTTRLREITIDNRQNWRAKHRKALDINYRKAPFYERCREYFDDCYRREWERLSDLCCDMLRFFLNALGITTRIVKSSELPAFTSSKSDLILAICRALGATAYMSGALGRDYITIGDFGAAGIEVTFQDYRHPVYRQTYPGFEPYMGIVDVLANESDPRSVIQTGSTVFTGYAP